MMYNEILFSVENKVATITLNRPDFGNAFAPESYKEIIQAVESCAENPAVGSIVVTGTGKHFSTGGDIKRFKKRIETKTYLNPETVALAGKMSATVRRCPKPVIAMVNGAAAGAGCSLALACDFRIVTPRSKFIMAFIKMGLSGDTGGLYYLQKLVGVGKTTELMMTGAPVVGQEAVTLGMANKLVPEEELSVATNAFAQQMANSPLAAIRRQKSLLNQFFYSDLDEYTKQEAIFMVECSRTADFAEAVDAFLEKRSPVFTGK